MKKESLSPRLALVASLVPHGSIPADVGTDHGYIPAWLLSNGVVSRCIATDINAGPLESARRTLARAGVLDRCELILCDGLAGCQENRADTVIIAGMGGDNISGILSRAPWTGTDTLLILQPMSKAEHLRAWLCENGFEIISEHLVRDAGKIYPVITARACAQSMRLSDAEMVIGRLPQVAREELFQTFLDAIIDKYQKAIDAQRYARGDVPRLPGMSKLLDEIKKIREEYCR